MRPGSLRGKVFCFFLSDRESQLLATVSPRSSSSSQSPAQRSSCSCSARSLVISFPSHFENLKKSKKTYAFVIAAAVLCSSFRPAIRELVHPKADQKKTMAISRVCHLMVATRICLFVFFEFFRVFFCFGSKGSKGRGKERERGLHFASRQRRLRVLRLFRSRARTIRALPL